MECVCGCVSVCVCGADHARVCVYYLWRKASWCWWFWQHIPVQRRSSRTSWPQRTHPWEERVGTILGGICGSWSTGTLKSRVKYEEHKHAQKGEACTLNWMILKYNAPVVITNHLLNRRVLTSIALQRKHTQWTEPMNTALHVVLLVFHVWRLKKQKLGQLYLREERSRVLHLSSLSATMDPQLCSRAELTFYSSSFSANTPFLTHNNLFSSFLPHIFIWDAKAPLKP